jgi:hypothetical protein
MKITDFGLWFLHYHDGERFWSTSIPSACTSAFAICYDGKCLGMQIMNSTFPLDIILKNPHMIKLKKTYTENRWGEPEIGRPLSLNDFDIVENPHYRNSDEII